MTVTSANKDAAPVGVQPSPEEVRAQMRRILSDPALQVSPARREFLRFVVEEALAGRADGLKGFTIALAVFGRKEDFDPQSDPVVRVEARRLRRDLDSYYATAGRQDRVLISIPKGGYVPHFECRAAEPATDAPPPPRAGSGRFLLAAVLLVAVLLGSLGWLGAAMLDFESDGSEQMSASLPRGPKLAVLPFLSQGSDPEHAYFAQGMTDQIVTDLTRFEALFVFSLPAPSDHQAASPEDRRLEVQDDIDYLLSGSVRRDGARIRVFARLVDAKSGRVVWADSFVDTLTAANVFDIQQDISSQVSAVLAGKYGVITEVGRADAQRKPSTSLAAYHCVLRYYYYQRFFRREDHAEVRACLERAVELDPEYADAWAVLANVYAQEYRFGFNPRPELYDARGRSLAAAKRAVDLEPRNPTAQLMLANALFDQADFDGFEAAGERAIALNPNDPEPLVHVGLRLVYMGEWRRGLALVNNAVALNPEHPEWYRDPIVYYYYQTGDYERALAESATQRIHRPWRYLFRTMILGQLGRREEARPVVETLLKLVPDVRERFWDMARVWNVPDPHIEHMVEGLRKAGLAITPATAAS